jgi:formamidopyrimidine-DNA glycosylase
MPEAPDVAVFERYFAENGLRRAIERTEVTEARLLAEISVQQLGRLLKGAQFTTTHRHGKYLFARIDGRGWLVLHFGMTGGLLCREKGEPTPDHARVTFHYEGGRRLHYLSQRLLGRLSHADDPSTYVAEHDLGPDILAGDLDSGKLAATIGERQLAIKSALMDQSLVAGLGNVYVDEALFQAGLDPRSRTDDLDVKTLRELINTSRRVVRMAIRRGEGPWLRVDRLPADWLLTHRGSGVDCPRCGGKVKKARIGGRSTYYCSRCQNRAG